jgi:enhancing lycopene biosynthesis protein 2
MNETKKDIICAIITRIDKIIPTIDNHNVELYIGRDIDTADLFDTLRAQQEYIACWVNDLADEIIRRS